MTPPQPLARLDLDRIDTLAFAGGGNRCWWQGGALSHLLDGGWPLPPLLVGTSAGAAVAASCMTDGPRAALSACLRLYADNARIFEWKGLARFRVRFAHRHVYPAWIESFVHADNFASLRESRTRLRVAFTRPARLLGLSGSIAAGTIAYLVEKHFSNSVHPRLPRLFGLRQDFADLHDCATLVEAHELLNASAAAPPLMPARRIGGAPAIDGGYTDNAPVHPQSPEERSRTLVLLTRHYPRLPILFTWEGRSYWQPSRRIPVSTWDCTPRTTIQDAFDLGRQDALALLKGRTRLGV